MIGYWQALRARAQPPLRPAEGGSGLASASIGLIPALLPAEPPNSSVRPVRWLVPGLLPVSRANVGMFSMKATGAPRCAIVPVLEAISETDYTFRTRKVGMSRFLFLREGNESIRAYRQRTEAA